MAKKEKCFATVKQNEHYYLIIDKKTNVQYLAATGTGIAPLVDTDGKLLLAESQ